MFGSDEGERGNSIIAGAARTGSRGDRENRSDALERPSGETGHKPPEGVKSQDRSDNAAPLPQGGGP